MLVSSYNASIVLYQSGIEMAAKPPDLIVADDKNDVLFIKLEGTHRGFKKEFLSQNIPPMMESILICPCCKGIMHDATVCNGAITCEGCVNPKGEKSQLTQLTTTVGEISVKCPLLRQCEWSGKLSATEEHLENCQIFRINCPLGCGTVLERSKEGNHIKVECIKRKVECKHCKEGFSAKDLDEHVKKCDFQQIKCPNGCGVELIKKDTVHHKNTVCLLTDIKCPYEKLGCMASQMKRGDLSKHKSDNMVQHQDGMMERLLKLETENVNLKKELAVAKKQLNVRIDAIEKSSKK